MVHGASLYVDMNANEVFILGFLIHKLGILLSQCWTKTKATRHSFTVDKEQDGCMCVVKRWDFYFFYNFIQKNDNNNKY